MSEAALELIDAIAAGDETAFAELYDRFSPRLLGLIAKVMGTGQDAEDVLQDVFREVWCNANRFDRRLGSQEVWLFMLARSRAIDHMRRSSTRAATQAAAGASDHRDTQQKQDPDFEQKANRALSLLPREQGDPIFLAFYRGLSGRQIAEVIGVPVGTVKTRIRLGMQKLRSHLAVQDQGQS